MPILKALNLLKIEDTVKTKALEFIIDTNTMNFQNILIQWSLNQIIITHMILEINFSYINYQQLRALGVYVYDTIYQKYFSKHLNV